ncbi:MAG: tryptophan--tRNA ligase [Alphaproteobacteria bacterium]|nr:MAG: tryptophan--tRNA ligase [Alphaproteobacteria bacterium]
MKIVSGIRPTGVLHIGNYFGAIQNWLTLQGNAECLFFMADLHALTTDQGQDIQKSTYDTAALYLACGIKPGSIFIQSHIQEHTELAWILACHTSMGWLNRMTQFKEKASNKEKANLGLYAYPTLMAADVLLYDATHVPVGEDQKQHVELARDIAISMNSKYKHDIFTVPEPMIQKMGARIMSLRHADQKMGKSNASDYERINLLDSDELIIEKVKKATSDSFPTLPETMNELEDRPAVKNLYTIYAMSMKFTMEQTVKYFEGKNFAFLKKELSDALINVVGPIREKAKTYQEDRASVTKVLEEGREKAQIKASKMVKGIKDILKL